MTHTALYDAFLEACQLEGCPLCRMQHAADLRYLERLFYERVNDYSLREQLRASLGFCSEHARMALDEVQGKALGLAIIYDDLLRVALEQIDKQHMLMPAQKKCPACQNQDEITAWVLSEISKHILSVKLQSVFAASQGLCFAHLRQAQAVLRDPGKRNVLIKLQREVMQALRSDLAEYIRKNDYRFIAEPSGVERDAWIRAVRMVA